MIKNRQRGTITNSRGYFSLQAQGSSVIEISFIGYAPQTIPVSKDVTLSIRLVESSELVDDDVVVAYGTMKKSDVNAAISSVKTSDIITTASLDLSGMLMGRAAGLTVIQNSAKRMVEDDINRFIIII